MSHFAEIDDNNTVLRVVVVSDTDTTDTDGVEVESIGAQFCTDLLGGTWIQTSYNRNMRTRYAGIGCTYDEARDVFISVQPFPSWVLDDATTEWVPPVPMIDGYLWDEDTVAWVQPDSPYPSWVWSDEIRVWEPPTPNTNAGYVWDEDTTSWVQPDSPYPSWVWDADGGRWEAPTPYPGYEDGPLYEWDEDTTSWVEVP